MTPRAILRTIALVFALVTASWLLGIGHDRATASQTIYTVGAIIPLYSYPTSSTWDTLVAVKQRYPVVPIIAIANPASGPGGSVDTNYAQRIPLLQSNGITVIGYVDTAYASRTLAEVEADIDTWKQFYPVTGIFFDQMSNVAGNESYYSQLSAYADSVGLPTTVGNPGTDTLESYLGTVDVLFIYENNGVPDLDAIAANWYVGYDKANFGVIPYGMPKVDRRFVRSAGKVVGWIYITDDVLPNPWDTLPGYFRRLVSALKSAGRVRIP